MELRNLTTFLKIVETGSFTKAAEQLLYSQSAVTMQIRQLEEELNVQLFERLGKKIWVTEQGQQLAAYSKQIVKLTEEIALIGADTKELQGTLRIVSMDSLIVAVLPKLLLAYHKLHPKVSITVKGADRMTEISRMLLQNEADCAFVFMEQQGWKDLHLDFSRTERIVFCARADHPLVGRENISVEEIKRQEVILTNQDALFSEVYRLHSPVLKEINTDLNIWNATGVLELVKLGAGVALLPHYLIASAVKRGEIAVLDVPEVDLTVHIQSMYHPHKLVTPQMSAFFALLREHPYD